MGFLLSNDHTGILKKLHENHINTIRRNMHVLERRVEEYPRPVVKALMI